VWVLEQVWIVRQILQKTEGDSAGGVRMGMSLWKVLPLEVEAWASGGGTDTSCKIEYLKMQETAYDWNEREAKIMLYLPIRKQSQQLGYTNEVRLEWNPLVWVCGDGMTTFRLARS